MQARNVVGLWAKSGLIWFLATLFFGMYLGLTGQLGISSPHAHAGLLGGLWAVGFSYLFNRASGDQLFRFAFWQWILFNLGVACQVFALWMVYLFDPKWGMFVGIAGGIVTVAAIWIVLTLWSFLSADQN